jgi:acetyltransferase-like isoleucine patch superfamily enzyme
MAQEKDRVAYIVSPIVIEDGVWIGLDCLVLGGTVGENSFVASQSIVLEDVPGNSYAAGRPAKRIRGRFDL